MSDRSAAGFPALMWFVIPSECSHSAAWVTSSIYCHFSFTASNAVLVKIGGLRGRRAGGNQTCFHCGSPFASPHHTTLPPTRLRKRAREVLRVQLTLDETPKHTLWLRSERSQPPGGNGQSSTDQLNIDFN